MGDKAGKNRAFLFLQGPHGPFFNGLAKLLRHTGAQTWRVGFNAGDEAFWHHKPSYIPYQGSVDDWPETFSQLLDNKEITDIVLYGDTRPVHKSAVEIARAGGLTIHVFEEGYLRPYWATYERGGTNGNSRLMDMSVADMDRGLKQTELDAPLPPAKWGDMRQHIFYGALYHWFVMFRNRRYKGFRPHRALTVGQEFRLYLRRLLFLPFHAFERGLATLRIRSGDFPYHIVLLQLEHDASFQEHSPFSTMKEFLDVVTTGFASGAPAHHHLVFKAHPLEDGRTPLRREIRRLARQAGVADRVHYVRGGKLARLLSDARTAITVNSTAAQQVLWRGIALKAFGTAVFDKPEFCSGQSLRTFFSRPERPDHKAYQIYRRYLLETSQVPGGFYASRSRNQLSRRIVDMMLSPTDPYDSFTLRDATPKPQLRLAK